MKKTCIKILSVVLCAIMVLGAAPLGGLVGLDLPGLFDFKAEAESYSGTCGDNLTWTLDTDTGVLNITGTGAMTDWSSFSAAPWYSYRSYIKTVNIASGVTTISYESFYDYYNLTSVTIPDSVTTIGGQTFTGCDSLTNVTVDENNKNYSSDNYGVLFNKDKTTLIQYPIGNTITSYTIPRSVTTIGKWAFYRCDNLISVTIPDSVTTIGIGAFNRCYSLTSVTIPDSVTTIGDAAFQWCDNLTRATIPDSVTTIGSYAFSGCDSLTSITIPDSVTTIGERAFSYCSSLISVTIPDISTTIVNGAFSGCTSLTSVTIPDSVTTIGAYAFSYCTSLTSVTIPDSVTTIDEGAFTNCDSLTSIAIPDGVTTIGDYAFNICRSLTSITVDANNKNYSSDNYGVLFNKDKTTLIQYPIGNTRKSYAIPDSVTYIGYEAFNSCDSLTNVTIGNSVTTIGRYVFSDCTNLTSVTIPDSVTTILDHAFNSCESLTSVTIGNSVTTIYPTAFHLCNSLTSITVNENNKNYSSDSYGVLFNKDKTTLVQYPIGNTRKSYTIPYGVTTIGNYAFCSCSSLTSITIPDSVTTISDGAFTNCASLTDVYYGGTQKQWNKITIGLYNESLTNATIHFTDSEHIHTPKTVTIPASCTVDGIEYKVCEDCGEPLGESTVIPASHIPGEWETEVEATVEHEGKRVKRCTVCGEITDTESIPKKVLSKIVDDESGIVLEFVDDDYTGEVDLTVTESFDGTAFQLIDTKTNAVQSFIYDITMTVDGVTVQPNGKVTVRIPLPENYDPAKTFVYHVDTATGKIQPMSAKHIDGFMVFETTHFSYYAIVEQLDVELAIKQPNVTTIKYGDTLVLQLEDVELPEGFAFEWSLIGDAVTTAASEDGKECRVTSTASGDVTVKATLVDENGDAVLNTEGDEISAEITLKSNASFWQKIVSFFKNLFRINRIIY